jgi:hypothetical protein
LFQQVPQGLQGAGDVVLKISLSSNSAQKGESSQDLEVPLDGQIREGPLKGSQSLRPFPPQQLMVGVVYLTFFRDRQIGVGIDQK